MEIVVGVHRETGVRLMGSVLGSAESLCVQQLGSTVGIESHTYSTLSKHGF